VRERRAPTGLRRSLTVVAVGVAAIAAGVAVVALLRGVDAASVVRGIVLFARIPALLFLTGSLVATADDVRRLSLGFVVGGVALIGNGVYTTVTTGDERFTAATFGRNGFAIALLSVTIVGAGLAFATWRWPPTGRRAAIGLGTAAIAAACLYGASATGTRMAFILLIIAAIGAAILHPRPITRRAVARMAIVAATTAAVLAASVAFTVAGARTVSVATDPGTTIDVVTDPGSLPSSSEIRTRGQFWDLAVQMARAEPLAGVGPFQWNVRRYVLDPEGPEIIVDAHNSYLQIGAEYGLVTLGAYVLLLVVALAIAGWWLIRSRARRIEIGWAGLSLAIAAFAYPLAELTNSHFFNVRMGGLGWLLIGATVAVATVSVRANAHD
ncbi:MAG: O-antigen ligase family protein, partial [Chloroflexi bacterium]|nr:O-antigen ligase family protein [Chloroflexota bacterium]